MEPLFIDPPCLVSADPTRREAGARNPGEPSKTTTPPEDLATQPHPSRLAPSSARREAARLNGAKSHGPITPQGKRNSSANSRRHGILSRCIVLPSENRQDFLKLLASLQGTFQPANEAAQALVEIMAISYWRQERIWAMETSGFQDEIENHPADLRPSLRAAKAFRSLADQSNTLQLLDRYETRFYRQFTRSLRLLLDLGGPGAAPQPDPQPSTPPEPDAPEPQNFQTNPASDTKQEKIAETPTQQPVQPAAPPMLETRRSRHLPPAPGERSERNPPASRGAATHAPAPRVKFPSPPQNPRNLTASPGVLKSDTMRSSLPFAIRIAALAAAVCAFALAADAPSPADLEFFETKVRPVLTKNCYGCHASDLKSPMGGLFLDTKNGMLTGGKSGPVIVPGNPGASLLIKAIRYQGPKMPPAGPLPEAVVADLAKWVAMGAPDPRVAQPIAAGPAIDVEKGRQYWAFQLPVAAKPPKVKNAAWALDPIDRFVLAQLEHNRLTPVADADRTAWIRRVTFDLTGLPPTPAEIDAFLADKTKTAYAKAADRLLASPRFGERWGRHWLDVARYADTVGRGRNFAFPVAYKYRDWVIDAFNRDLPYDQFVRDQIAGDLLPSKSAAGHNEQLTATGFLALGSLDLAERNPAVFTMDAVDEQINVVSRAVMGVTVGCARCHDHKFDPIPTTDYYALAGIFKSTDTLSGLQRRPRDNTSYFQESLLAQLTHEPNSSDSSSIDSKQESDRAELQAQVDELNRNPRKALAKAGIVPVAQKKGKKKGAPGAAPVNQADAMKANQFLQQQARQILNKLDQYPLPSDLVMGVRDDAHPADSEVYIKGEVADLGPKVPRGFPQVMSKPGENPPIGPTESGRLEFAQWLTRRDNPTTARVYVNRVWEHLFGRGIVATADNFGKMGEQPSDQALLDYLAVRFMDQGWSTKKLVRELVLSRTYRLSAASSARNETIDPGNVYLWRTNRQRLEVEPIRDAMLMIAGNLDLNRPEPVDFRRSAPVGGGANGGRGGKPVDYSDAMRNRSVYVPVVRNFLPAMYETFDFPEPSETKGVREVTTVPTQALFMMNSRFVIGQARNAAAHLLEANLATPQERITRAYREVLGRVPTPAESNRALIFIHNAQEEAASQPPAPQSEDPAARRAGRRLLAGAGRGPGRGGRGATEPPLAYVTPEISAWEHFYQALFASAEFRYRS